MSAEYRRKDFGTLHIIFRGRHDHDDHGCSADIYGELLVVQV